MTTKVCKLVSLICTIFFVQRTNAQNTTQIADSLYRAKNYLLATGYYRQIAEQTDFKPFQATAYYNAACCLALQNKRDSAFTYLNKAIEKGYNNRKNLLNDNDLTSLHATPQWAKIVARLPAASKPNNDPAKARFITTDIHHFWMAWDKAYQDTAQFRTAFKTAYFDKASRGMDDYMALKVESINAFVAHIQSAPRFYRSIRRSTLGIDAFKPRFMAAFQRLKQLYPAATFPDVYFIIGAFTSGGTVSDAGLLLGANQASRTDTTVTDELSPRLLTRLSRYDALPYVVAHESIHFQQGGIKGDTITLGYAINEGMADFIGELISGHTANEPLFEWANGKEQMIWNRFKEDMYLNRYNNWIANSKQSGPDNPPDQGYWVGYQICKAYYEQEKDKKQAIYDMLHLQDYRKFLQQSGWEQKVAKMKGQP